MKEHIKVSIIVPIYNVQKYIYRCVDSLLHQDYRNVEIILVDDGSSDDSGKIIDDIRKSDNRIIVIHKTNGGVSTARNAGLLRSTGDYVMFVDGDDWVDEDYVSYFLGLICKNDIPIGMNKYNYFDCVKPIGSKNADHLVCAEKVIEWLYSGVIFVGVWNKIYSRAFLFERGLLFDESIWYGEGMLFNIECLQYVESVVVGEKPVYHQTNNPDSAMRKFSLESNLCGIRSLEKQKQVWKKKTKAIDAEWTYHRYRFNKTIISGLLRTNTKECHEDVYKECIHDIRRKLMIPIRMEKSIKAKIWWICFAIDPSLMVNRRQHNRETQNKVH